MEKLYNLHHVTCFCLSLKSFMFLYVSLSFILKLLFNIGKMEKKKKISVHNLWKNGVEEDEAFLKLLKRKYSML